jgi:hypothetical protein
MILAMLGIIGPTVTYVSAWLGLKFLRSPRYVLVAFWALNVLWVAIETSGDPTSIILTMFLIGPVGIALSITWLWVIGWLCQRIGLSRIGTKWRGMAALLLGSVRRTRISSEPVTG